MRNLPHLFPLDNFLIRKLGHLVTLLLQHLDERILQHELFMVFRIRIRVFNCAVDFKVLGAWRVELDIEGACFSYVWRVFLNVVRGYSWHLVLDWGQELLGVVAESRDCHFLVLNTVRLSLFLFYMLFDWLINQVWSFSLDKCRFLTILTNNLLGVEMLTFALGAYSFRLFKGAHGVTWCRVYEILLQVVSILFECLDSVATSGVDDLRAVSGLTLVREESLAHNVWFWIDCARHIWHYQVWLKWVGFYLVWRLMSGCLFQVNSGSCWLVSKASFVYRYALRRDKARFGLCRS